MLWSAIVAIAIVGGLGVVLVGWLVRSELQERRRAKLLAQLSERYRKARPALPATASEPSPQVQLPTSRKVTVDELVARLEAEGRSVRLNWEEKASGKAEDWPTAVMPRVEPEEYT